MLTDKELENDELQENFDKYKSAMKMEIQKYIVCLAYFHQ